MSTEMQTLAKSATTMRGYFEKRKDIINMSLARAGITSDRVIQALFTAGQKTPDLFRCTPQSAYKAILLAAQSGLIPDGVTQHAHLIPRKNKRGELECNLQIGYRGYLVLCRRSGQITVIRATLVRKGDKFKEYKGTDERIEHEPLDDIYDAAGKERPITHCYAVATFKEGHKDFEVMPVSEVEALRKRSKAFGPAWDSDYGEMCKKTVLRRLCKRLPQSEDMPRLLELDTQAEMGIPQELGQEEGVIDITPESVASAPAAEAPTPAPTPKPTPAAKPAAPAPKPEPKVDEETGEVTEEGGDEDLA